MIKEKLKKGTMTIVNVDGSIVNIKPKGKHFTLDELQDAVTMVNYGEPNYIEFAPTPFNDYLVVVNEEGIWKNMPLNALYANEFGVLYRGPVVIVDSTLID